MSVLSDKNVNLTPSQNFILLWNQNFGHRKMQFIQHMFHYVHPFVSPKFTRAEEYEIPKFETCEYVNSCRHLQKGSAPISKPETDGAFKDSNTRPGACASIDHL